MLSQWEHLFSAVGDMMAVSLMHSSGTITMSEQRVAADWAWQDSYSTQF